MLVFPCCAGGRAGADPGAVRLRAASGAVRQWARKEEREGARVLLPPASSCFPCREFPEPVVGFLHGVAPGGTSSNACAARPLDSCRLLASAAPFVFSLSSLQHFCGSPLLSLAEAGWMSWPWLLWGMPEPSMLWLVSDSHC